MTQNVRSIASSTVGFISGFTAAHATNVLLAMAAPQLLPLRVAYAAGSFIISGVVGCTAEKLTGDECYRFLTEVMRRCEDTVQKKEVLSK